MHLLTPRALVAVTLAVSALAGCGDDEGTTSSTTTTQEVTRADTIEVTAIDYAYEGLPSEVDSGTALALRNTSAAELHELVALRLPDDETRSAEELLALPMEELEALFAVIFENRADPAARDQPSHLWDADRVGRTRAVGGGSPADLLPFI